MDSQPNFCVIMIPKDTNYVLTYEKTKNLEVHFWNKSEVNEQIQHCASSYLKNPPKPALQNATAEKNSKVMMMSCLENSQINAQALANDNVCIQKRRRGAQVMNSN